MTARQEHNSPPIATKLTPSTTKTSESLRAFRTSSTDKAGAEEGQIELGGSPGASERRGGSGTADKDNKGATHGWTDWRKDRKMKQGEDGTGIGEPLEQVRSNEELLADDEAEHAGPRRADGGGGGDDERGGMRGDAGPVVYKVYKRRWFGLAQLVLLNVVVSWDVSSLSICVHSPLLSSMRTVGVKSYRLPPHSM